MGWSPLRYRKALGSTQSVVPPLPYMPLYLTHRNLDPRVDNTAILACPHHPHIRPLSSYTFGGSGSTEADAYPS